MHSALATLLFLLQLRYHTQSDALPLPALLHFYGHRHPSNHILERLCLLRTVFDEQILMYSSRA